jgi:hypothetical protein
VVYWGRPADVPEVRTVPVPVPSSTAFRTAAERLYRESTVVAEPESPRPGAWVGSPSAVLDDGVWWLAYRVREPVAEGRGMANVVARSDDGVTFEPVVGLGKEHFGDVESLERPTLVRVPDGGWRLYVSCATPRTKHWRVDLVESDSVEGLATAAPMTVLPGSDAEAVKDPVIRVADGRWHLWASVHPLDDPHATDRMTTAYASSADGGSWTWHGTALAPRPGEWDSRGVRLTTVFLDGDRSWALYDGRATAAENWEERTGLAVADGTLPDGSPLFRADDDGPVLQSPHAPHGLRYADAVPLPDGTTRWFFEATRPDGGHDLRTALLPS